MFSTKSDSSFYAQITLNTVTICPETEIIHLSKIWWLVRMCIFFFFFLLFYAVSKMSWNSSGEYDIVLYRKFLFQPGKLH